jgi:hypothetical protein
MIPDGLLVRARWQAERKADSSAALRNDKQKQATTKQPQVLRLRSSLSAANCFAQDDRVLGLWMAEEKRDC